mgnify:CR=1 FL=1
MQMPMRPRFIIFAQGRTGSTLLTRTLNTHPEICCHDEILSTPKLMPVNFLERSAQRSNTQAFGFHVKIYQLRYSQGIDNANKWLTDMCQRGWKIIYLWRKNLLRQAISNIFTEVSDLNKSQPKRITLPVERLKLMINLRQHNLIDERVALTGLNHMELIYERDLEDAQQQADTFELIQDYIGVSRIHLKPQLKKMVQGSLSDLLINYDEVVDWISSRPEYSHFLDT